MRTLLVAMALGVLAMTAAGEVAHGPSPEVAAENGPPGPEIFRIRIANSTGGAIAVSRDEGASWLPIGRVTGPATGANPAGYTASRWATDSSVCASAVNAVHVKIANHAETGRGVIFSIIPAGETVGAAQGHRRTSIATDIAPGASIFGGGLAPPVDSPVLVVRDAGPVRLARDYVPSAGDVLLIVVHAPPSPAAEIEFENAFGGLIRLRYAGGEEKVIGQVLRPVAGVGRFPGTIDAAPGRIRANHPGVIDISTSPIGQVGGFQIVPRGHAGSPELSYVLTSTQWMVVGPVSALEPSWEGVAPLFARYLVPSYRADDLQHEDWMRRLLSRCQVQVRFGDGDWELMPRIAIDPSAPADTDTHERGRTGLWRIGSSLRTYSTLSSVANTALSGVTAIRIMLPRAQFWPQREGAPR